MEDKKKCKYCKSDIAKDAKVCPVCKKKQGGKLKFILLALVVIGFISALTNKDTSNKTPKTSKVENAKEDINTDDKNPESTVEETREEVTATPTPAKQEPVKEAFETSFSAGHYTAGIDFPGGTYNIVATKGSGNISSSNMYSGGLNEIMADKADDMYISEFKNAKLEADTVLSISGNLTVKITTEEAATADMVSRVNDLTEEVELSSGNYVAGTDFPSGVYDILLVKGSGNVSSSNMYEGGLNEIMGSGDDMYIKEFKHASFSDGDTLEISGVTVKLVPSK